MVPPPIAWGVRMPPRVQPPVVEYSLTFCCPPHHVLRAEQDGAITVEVDGPLPPWLPTVLQRLAVLLRLPEGWNSYRARRVSPKAVAAVLRTLPRIAGPTAPAPAVVPLADGGVQVEWHQGGIDLELAFAADGRISLSYVDSHTGVEWDEDHLTDLAPVRETLAALTARG